MQKLAAAQEKAAEARMAEQLVKQAGDGMQADIAGRLARMTDPFDDLPTDMGLVGIMAKKNAAVRKAMRDELVQHQKM